MLKPRVKLGTLGDAIQRLHAFDSVLATSLYLGLDQNNHTLSLGLLILWICFRCIQQIWNSRNQTNWPEKTLPCMLVLGLISFHARPIIRLDDNPGGSLYILIAAFIYLGSLYSLQQKKILLRWISGAALAINLKIFIEGTTAGLHLVSKTWMVTVNNNVHALGFGRINSLASIIAFFTVIAIYGARTDKKPIARILYAATLTSGYFLCWQSNSALALGAPLLAATSAFLICKKDYFQKGILKAYKLITIGAITLTSVLLAWHLSLKEKLSIFNLEGQYLNTGEQWRMEQWSCWIQNSILAGNNKIIHGIGFNTEAISQLCGNNNPDGGLTQLISQHGLLGALALALLLIFIAKSIFQSRKIEEHSSPPSKLMQCRWSEAALGMITTVLLCNLITPSYSGSYFNAGLTGLIFSLGIYSAPEKDIKI